MSRRGDKSLVKIYKDLLISKRELIDLRQSITKTLSGLKPPQPKNLAAIKKSKKVCLACHQHFEPAIAHHCKPKIYKCPICALHFASPQMIQKHRKQSHHQCKLCREQYNEHPLLHEVELCGETRIGCEKCGAQVKRKEIDDHITRCCFSSCHKCKRMFYYKSYLYHLNRCTDARPAQPQQQKKENSLLRTKKLGRKMPTAEQITRSHYAPCSLLQ